jgi:hypothetical protein
VLKISKTGHDMQVVFSQSYELFIWGQKREKTAQTNFELCCSERIWALPF